MESFNGWCPYELREIDDAEKRAAICGVGVDEVRKGVKAILLKSVCLNTEPSLRDGAMGASREDGAVRTANASCTSRTPVPEALVLCKGANRSTESREANLPVASDRPAKRLCVEKSPVLGVHDGVAYALLYNGILHDRRVNGGNVLTRKTLVLIREDLGEAECDKLIVYGEATRLLRETLAAEKIEFRQTPYDLVFGR